MNELNAHNQLTSHFTCELSEFDCFSQYLQYKARGEDEFYCNQKRNGTSYSSEGDKHKEILRCMESTIEQKEKFRGPGLKIMLRSEVKACLHSSMQQYYEKWNQSDKMHIECDDV